MSSYAIAIDLGGTSIKAAAVRDDGEILARDHRRTRRELSAESVLDDIAGAARWIAELGGEPSGIGMGVPGVVTPSEGHVLRLPNFAGWDGLPLRAELEERLRGPLFLENDANCAALGEGWLGAARGVRDFMAITLGTGVGSGLVLDGRIWSGPAARGGEFGHVKVEDGGERCGCGARGCVETYASGLALVRQAEQALREGAAPVLARLAEEADGAVTPEILHRAAEQGDEQARQIFEAAGHKLGRAISDVACLLGVSFYVVGGGVAGALTWMLPSLRTAVLEGCFTMDDSELRVVPASCGPDAGLFGAARLALPRS